MEIAKEIASVIYPEKWKDVGGGLMVDQNANLRGAAITVVMHMITSLRREKTASAVMQAFFRREHKREPTEEEKEVLISYMGVALMAAEFEMVSTRCE